MGEQGLHWSGRLLQRWSAVWCSAGGGGQGHGQKATILKRSQRLLRVYPPPTSYESAFQHLSAPVFASHFLYTPFFSFSLGTSTPSAMLRIVAFAAVLGATHGFVTPNVVRSAVPAEVSE